MKKPIRKTKKKLVPDIITPNVITVIRICLIPIFVLFFYLYLYLDHDALLYIAVGIFAVAAFTDFLDGYIARKYKRVTTVGKFLDPIADKVLVATAFIVLLTNEDFMGMYDEWLPVTMGIFVAVILARELIISAFREIAAEQQIVLSASMLGKVKTTVQDVALIVLMVCIPLANDYTSREAGMVVFIVGYVLLCAAVLLTIASGVEYIVTNRQVFRKKTR